jgi:2-methylcitrate dehydratase PrpD
MSNTLAALRAAMVERCATAPSDAARAHARLLVLDTVGCALAGRRVPEVSALETLLAQRDPGGFRIAAGAGLTVTAAAQVLAMAATWHEACEGHAAAHGRPGVPVIAALLPLALQRGASLGQFVDAVVFGYEIGARAGAWLRIRPGMHVDGNWPALGVAAGATALLGLDAVGIARAVDVAACQLPTSLYLPVTAGCTARNTYLGHSATLGLDAAYAALAGIDAPAGVLDHYALDHSAAQGDEAPDPGEEWILAAYLKPYAAVRHVHYGATAARRLRDDLGGATGDIRGIALSIYQEAITYCGNRAPRTPIQAQFSLAFGVAAMLRFGDLAPDAYEPGRFDDAELRRLEALVEVRPDADLTDRAERGATLRLAVGDRELVESVGTIPGDAARPLTETQVVGKFLRYACGGSISASAGERQAGLWLHGSAETALETVWALLDD